MLWREALIQNSHATIALLIELVVLFLVYFQWLIPRVDDPDSFSILTLVPILYVENKP